MEDTVGPKEDGSTTTRTRGGQIRHRRAVGRMDLPPPVHWEHGSAAAEPRRHGSTAAGLLQPPPTPRSGGCGSGHGLQRAMSRAADPGDGGAWAAGDNDQEPCSSKFQEETAFRSWPSSRCSTTSTSSASSATVRRTTSSCSSRKCDCGWGFGTTIWDCDWGLGQ